MVVALVSPPPRVRAAVCAQRCVCVCLCLVLPGKSSNEQLGWVAVLYKSSGTCGESLRLGFVQRIQNIQGVEALRVARGSQQNSTTKDHSMHSSSKEDGTRARRSSRLNSLAPAKQANEDVHDLYIHNHPSRRRRSVRGPRCHAPICRENNKLFLLSKRWSTPLAWWRGAGPSVRPSARCARR